jgi:hypothetical protein
VNRRGVCYDVGSLYSGLGWRFSSRPRFDPGITRRELEIIKTELHCNAVRVIGTDIGRLTRATGAALDLGLEVWLSPAVYDKSPDQTLDRYLAVARAAEKLRLERTPEPSEPAAAEAGRSCAAHSGGSAAGAPAPAPGQAAGQPDSTGSEPLCQDCPGSLCLRARLRARSQVSAQIVFCLGGELSLFMRGIVPGRTIPERVANMIGQARAGDTTHTGLLDGFLDRASKALRGAFGGPLTYAALIGEKVDWTRFDFVGLDHYRDARIKDRYADMLRPFFGCGRPVVVTEVGMRGYRGAEDSGTLGFGVIDQKSQFLHQLPLVGRLVKASLNGEYVRDEGLQARELTEVLAILDAAGVDGVFVNSFVEPLSPFSDDPRHDLDMSALSLVKSYENGRGSTFPGVSWEPKEAFRAVADCYAGQPAGP